MQTIYIVPKSIPRVRFAHTHATDNYHIEHDVTPDFLEITYIERATAKHTYYNDDGIEEVIVPPESIIVHAYDKRVVCSSAEEHRHCTVGINIAFDFVAEGEKDALAFPSVCRDADFVPAAAAVIREIEKDILLEPDNVWRSTAHICELFSLFDKHVKQAQLYERMSPAAIHYVSQAKEYILHHLHEKLTVEKIAESLHLSRGHLCYVFKSVCGMSVIRCINEMRLQKVKDLMLHESTTLADACAFVGIEDPNYISRMFRKYHDTTISEIKASVWEQTN